MISPKAAIGLFAVFIVFVLVLMGIHKLDIAVWEAEEDLARTVEDAGSLILTADYVVGGVDHPQHMTISVSSVEKLPYAVKISGPVTIEPPLPGCDLAAVNKMDWEWIGVSWKCGDTFFNQEFGGLNPWPENDRVWWVNTLVTVRIMPTGIIQQ